jgi:hypothetical protein
VIGRIWKRDLYWFVFGLLETKAHRDGARKRVYFYSSFFKRVRGRAFYFHFCAFTELKEGQRELEMQKEKKEEEGRSA